MERSKSILAQCPSIQYKAASTIPNTLSRNPCCKRDLCHTWADPTRMVGALSFFFARRALIRKTSDCWWDTRVVAATESTAGLGKPRCLSLDKELVERAACGENG